MPEQTTTEVEIKKYGSFKELQLQGDELVMDYEDDAWGFAAIPPYGIYDFKWVLDKDGITENYVDKDKKGSLYYNIHIVGTLKNDKEWEGTQVDVFLSTRIYRGKGLSTAAGFLQKAGLDIQKNAQKMNRKITHLFVVELVEKLLSKEPMVKAELDWRGSYVYGKDPKTGKDLWDNCCNRYEDFPMGPEGVRESVFTLEPKHARDKMSHEIRGQMRITRFLTPKEEAPARRVVGGASKGSATGASPMLVVDEPELETASTSNGKGPVMAQASKEDEKDSEMLIID
jgi:hypothetical protein